MNTYQRSLQKWEHPIGVELLRDFPAEQSRRMEANSECAFGNTILRAMARRHLENKGKLLRAHLPLWIGENLGGAIQHAMHLGVACELMHNATLVHDDIQDGDTHRRGQPTLWKRYGIAQAINVGDGLFFYAQKRLHEIDDPALSLELSKLVSSALLSTIQGQTLELDFQEWKSSLESLKTKQEQLVPTYFEIVRAKTGALFCAASLGGAKIAGMPQALRDTLRDLTLELGELFQVQDDYLDLVGDKGRTSKANDIAEGKLSYPVARALSQSNLGDASMSELIAILSLSREQTRSEDRSKALELLEDSGSLKDTQAWLQRRVDDFGEKASRESSFELLLGLAEYMVAPLADFL